MLEPLSPTTGRPAPRVPPYETARASGPGTPTGPPGGERRAPPAPPHPRPTTHDRPWCGWPTQSTRRQRTRRGNDAHHTPDTTTDHRFDTPPGTTRTGHAAHPGPAHCPARCPTHKEARRQRRGRGRRHLPRRRRAGRPTGRRARGPVGRQVPTGTTPRPAPCPAPRHTRPHARTPAHAHAHAPVHRPARRPAAPCAGPAGAPDQDTALRSTDAATPRRRPLAHSPTTRPVHASAAPTGRLAHDSAVSARCPAGRPLPG